MPRQFHFPMSAGQSDMGTRAATTAGKCTMQLNQCGQVPWYFQRMYLFWYRKNSLDTDGCSDQHLYRRLFASLPLLAISTLHVNVRTEATLIAILSIGYLYVAMIDCILTMLMGTEKQVRALLQLSEQCFRRKY